MVDPTAESFFREAMADPDNHTCADLGPGKAEWASVSHGIYLSIGAAGLHRSLGVKVSRVQSTSMDSWKPVHLKMMELGGNRRFAEFLKSHGVPDDMPIREKYSTRAAAWYRESLLAQAEGRDPPQALPPGSGHLPEPGSVSETQAVLDKVFAVAPLGSQMTAGGVSRAIATPQSRWRNAPTERSACAKLCATLANAVGAATRLAVAEPPASGARGRRTLHPGGGPDEAPAAKRSESRSRSREKPCGAEVGAELLRRESSLLLEAPLAAAAA